MLEIQKEVNYRIMAEAELSENVLGTEITRRRCYQFYFERGQGCLPWRNSFWFVFEK